MDWMYGPVRRWLQSTDRERDVTDFDGGGDGDGKGDRVKPVSLRSGLRGSVFCDNEFRGS